MEKHVEFHSMWTDCALNHTFCLWILTYCSAESSIKHWLPLKSFVACSEIKSEFSMWWGKSSSYKCLFTTTYFSPKHSCLCPSSKSLRKCACFPRCQCVNPPLSYSTHDRSIFSLSGLVQHDNGACLREVRNPNQHSIKNDIYSGFSEP